MTIHNEDERYGDGIDSMREELERLAERPRPHVFITVSGGVGDYVTAGEVDVTFIDWDNFEDASSMSMDELLETMKGLRALPETGEIGQWRANALESMSEVIDRETRERSQT